MFALQAILVLVTAAILGIGSAWLAVEREVAFEVIRSGNWTAWPRAGAEDGDPYIRARVARAGTLPLASTEGIAFTAREDDEGRPLAGNCDYTVSGRMPASQYWTLTLYRDADLTLIDNAANRYGFDSADVLREPDGDVRIDISPVAQPGNWLPGDADAGELRLVLRLYDTPLATGGGMADLEAPHIERGDCR